MYDEFSLTYAQLESIVICAAGVYIATIVFTRLSGKRSFSKMSSVDFAMTVAIGSILATVILSSTVTLMQGIIGLGVVYILQMLASLMRLIEPIRKAIDNKPILLMDGPEILYTNLKKARITLSDLRSKLREANVIDLSQVKAVIFETTGDIAVLHSSKEDLTIQPWIIEDVMRK